MLNLFRISLVTGILVVGMATWAAAKSSPDACKAAMVSLPLVAGGLPTDLSGTWTAGVDGAQPGFIMEANPAVGDFYRQEFLAGEAEDMAEVKSLTASESVPATTCTNECLETEESSTLAPGDIEHKFYKKNVATS